MWRVPSFRSGALRWTEPRADVHLAHPRRHETIGGCAYGAALSNMQNTAESSDKERRRARKRATDRKAQQSHRERREAYVKQLETSLRSLTEQHTADDRYKALHEENVSLREQRSRLQARLRQIYNLADIAIPNDLCAVSGNDSAAGRDSGNSPAGTRDACGVGMETTSPILADATQQEPGRGCEGGAATTENIPLVRDMRDDLDGTQDNLFDDLGAADFTLGDGVIFSELDLPQNCSLVLGAAHPPQHDNHMPAQGDLPSPSWGSGLSFDRLVPEARAFACLPVSSRLGIGISCSSDIVSIPRYCPPVGIADKMLTNFLEEARLEHRNARFDTSEPSLSRLLSDPPHTVLAFRLFHFLSGARPMPLHIFMGIFWLQYLVLRASQHKKLSLSPS